MDIELYKGCLGGIRKEQEVRGGSAPTGLGLAEQMDGGKPDMLGQGSVR